MRRNAHHFADLNELGNVQTPLPLLVLGYERLWTVQLLSQIRLRDARVKSGLLQAVQKSEVQGGRKGLQGAKRLMFDP